MRNWIGLYDDMLRYYLNYTTAQLESLSDAQWSEAIGHLEYIRKQEAM